MKVRSREINIFSMSALDLFASGMGAFIMLAVMGMLFMPHTGDSEERIEEIKKVLAAVRQQRDDAQRKSEALERELQDTEKRVTEAEQELKEIKIPDLDVVICLDITGSMRDQIEGLKEQVNDLAKVLDALAPTAGVGIVAFGDREYQQPLYVQEIALMSNIAQLESFVNRLTPGMDDPGANPSPPEAVAMALDRAVRMNWRPIAQRRFIVVVTDAPAYPEMESSAIETARAFASGDGQFVSAVMPVMPSAGSVSPERFLRELADAGGGEFVNAGAGQSMIANVLMAVLNS